MDARTSPQARADAASGGRKPTLGRPSFFLRGLMRKEPLATSSSRRAPVRGHQGKALRRGFAYLVIPLAATGLLVLLAYAAVRFGSQSASTTTRLPSPAAQVAAVK